MSLHNIQVASIDVGTVFVIIGSLSGYLPPTAAILAIFWYLVLIYDRFFTDRRDGE